MSYRMIAVKLGDLLKYDTSINEINRAAEALFRFRKETFPNNSITSSRAQLVYDWVLSLARQTMTEDERNALLIKFCKAICPNENIRDQVLKLLDDMGLSSSQVYKEDINSFLNRDFHPEIVKHSKNLYLQGNYFHAIFEASKAYNCAVKEKSCSDKDGQALMMEVWSPNGVLKITRCETETDKNVQDGIKFLSAGLMQAVRNPTAHEPAITWPITKQDCLEILSFISFLYRQLDKAVFFPH